MDKQLGSNLTDVTLSPVNSTLNENDVRDYDIVNNPPPLSGRLKPGDQEPPSVITREDLIYFNIHYTH